MTSGELRKLAFDFRAARAVTCALETGVFAALGREAASADELARRCELDPRATRILLDALVSLGVLERDGGGRVRIVPALAGSLLEREPGYVGNLLLHDLWHWTSWAHLDRAVREGRKLEDRSGDPHLGDPAVLRRFLPNYVAAMEQSDPDSAARVAERLAALAPHSILDLGAGTGRHLIALLEKLPEATATLSDLPFVLEAAGRRVAERGLEGRVELLPFDFTSGPVPPGHDLILISRVLMGLDPETARALVVRCAQALPPGGHLAIHDYDPHSRVGALLSLDMLLNTGGEVHDGAAVLGWLAAAGLPVREERVLPYTRLWIAGPAGEGEEVTP